MRLRPELVAIALCALLAGAHSIAAPASSAPVTPAEVERAVAAIKADPDLATTRTVSRLSWDLEEQEEKKPKKESDWKWLAWIGELFSWLAGISQMLMWLLIAALVALLAVILVRIFGSARGAGVSRGFVAPTHVQDLDIRPESLPDDVGAAARALWDRGDHRAALALLYRGLLSRLAHVYEVPIRASSTEGDCLDLAARKLEAKRLEFVTRLVRTWQRAIYGGLTVEDTTVHELCANFDVYIERPRAEVSPRRARFTAESAA